MWNITFAFFDSLVHGSDKLERQTLEPAARGSLRRKGLRALQEGDPKLFDLRKYDSGATVYSVLCQNPRPPSAYSPAEVAAMPAKRRDGLVRYWNFTEDRPAYYECPNPNFPHLSFLEGRHPLGYCLPCCQKTEAHPGSRREKINQHCLSAYAAAPDDDGPDGEEDDKLGALMADDELIGSSRHTLSYGKRIRPGRLATVNALTTELMSAHVSTDDEVADGALRLLGVPQGVRAIPSAPPLRPGQPPGGGYFHALAAAINVESHHVGRELAKTALAMGENFRTMGLGTAGCYFRDANDLANTILETFASTPDDDAGVGFTKFSPGGEAFDVWEDLVNDLVYARYGVSVVYFLDPAGSGETAVHVPPDTLSHLNQGDVHARYAIIYKIGHPEAKRGGGGIYPLVQYDKNQAAGMQVDGVFRPDSPMVQALKEMVGATLSSDSDALGGDARDWDLNALARHLDKRASAFRPRTKLVGRRGLCYAAVLERKSDGAAVYVPITYSPHYPDDPLARRYRKAAGGDAAESPMPVHVGPLSPKMAEYGPPSALAAFIATLPEAKFQVVCALRRAADGPYVGIGVQCGRAGVLYFYHAESKAVAPVKSAFGPAKNLPSVELPLMPAQIDSAVVQGKIKRAADIPEGARMEAYRSHLYQHFLSEFAAHVYSLRDESVRAQLADAMERKRPLAAVREVLTAGLKRANPQVRLQTPEGFSTMEAILLDEDVEAIATVAGRVFAQFGRTSDARKRLMAQVLDGVSLSVDRADLMRIAQLPEAESRRKLAAIMKKLVAARPMKEIAAKIRASESGLPSMFTACANFRPADSGESRVGAMSGESRGDAMDGWLGHCLLAADGPKLEVPAEEFDTLVALLAADLRNPLKRATLQYQTSGVFDDLNFRRRPGEVVEIRL